jgi:tripartite-type tricarboxylate transporter receptor subunit TctC
MHKNSSPPRPRKLPKFLAAATLFMLQGVAFAQAAFPSKPITFVVPFPAGGSTDVLARVWADFASKELGSPVVVDNKPGANGGVAMQYAARAPADGYTLVLSTGSISLNPFSYKKLAYKNSDFDGVALLGTVSQVLIANPALGVKSVGELIKRAKERPELAFASSGIGNSTHLNVEIMARHYGLKFLHSPYKGSAPAMMGLISGDAQFMVDVATTSVVQVRAGKVVPLAIFGPERIPDLPGVPTIHELGLPDSIDGGWYAISAPAGTPKSVIERLNAVATAMWKDPASRARLDAGNFTRFPETHSGAVKAFVDRDARLWGPLITDLGIKND